MIRPIQEDAAAPAPVALTIALTGGALAVAFEAYGTLTAMSAAARDLGRLDLYAWAFTAFLIAQVLAIVLAGRLVDRIGPVMPLAIGTMVFALGLLGAGLAQSMLWLLLTRAVQGFGGGALNLAFMVVVAEAYDKRQRAWLMSVLSFCWMLPSFIGPPLSAWITTRFSWHWVFLGVVPALVAVAAFGWRPLGRLSRLPRPVHANPDPVPIWAAFATAFGAALLQSAGQWLNQPGLVAGVIGLAVLVIGLPRMMPPRFGLVGRGLPALMWTRLLACGAFFTAEAFAPLLLQNQYGFSLHHAGLFLALGATGWALGSLVQSWRGLRIRRDQIIHLGASVILAGVGAMTAAARLGWHWVILAVGFTAAGMGMGLLVSSISLSNMQLSAPHSIGRNTSSVQVSEGLGNALVTGAAGAIFAGLHQRMSGEVTFGAIYLLCVLSASLALLVAFRIGAVRNESAGVGHTELRDR